ncbi:hypothetical protein ACG33_09850 [Steroidobacter denitrificans]|uniref:Type IV secretion system protein VirB10 n=1 Tax=Steroidobacter denitrificans TaxID=465721 RepID=A0A127FCQ8_STEDE|nr:type IV secretion system protein VirB10 [Steroidobacter denitrificans]AMN47395.1 hypothetical protein ACG33_09850 [Steroidobacter denitrificans]
MNPADQDPKLQTDGFTAPEPAGEHGAQAASPGSGLPGSGRPPQPETQSAASGWIRRGFVAGERGTPSVSQAVSLQSRTSSMMSAALMIAMGLGLLGWYYTRVITRHAHAQAPASAELIDTPSLPPLAPIEPPRMVAVAHAAETAHPSGDNGIDLGSLPRMALEATAGTVGMACLPEAGSCAAETMTPARRALERRLAGAPFMLRSARGAAADPFDDPDGGSLRADDASSARGRESGAMSQLLRHDVAAVVRAQVLPTRRLLLPKGAFIDCTLETAIDSTLPGMTTCITAIDTFGADGKVVLLERGTKLVGETRGQVRQGAARVFVVWTEARTPTGVVVALDSPGTDELGRSGLPGKVERHFWDRFGAAILISMIDGAMQAAVQSAGSGNATVIYNPSSSRDILTEVLRGTIDIPPTITKAQGERIQVLVARDLDFSTVYDLQVRRQRPQSPAYEPGAAGEG